jgi:probable F420-dependent oxidoreductase
MMRMTAVASMERLARLTTGRRVRVQWAGVPTLEWQRDLGLQRPLLELHERFAAEGRDFWTGCMHVPITTVASIEHSLLFAQSGDYVWHEVVSAKGEAAKLALLRDPDWRARARHAWDEEASKISPFPQPRGVLLDNSANDAGPVGITLGEYADRLGVHCSDALAEWFVCSGVASSVTMPPWAKDEAMVVRLLRDPRSVGNISDAGAHGQMFCGIGYNIMLFSHYVRETGVITIEEAVHAQTGKLADHFGFRDRGELRVGKRADVTVFALDEVELRPQRKTFDVPDGEGGCTWRWTRDPAPVRLTLVNGVPTFVDGKSTSARPGVMLSPRAERDRRRRGGLRLRPIRASLRGEDGMDIGYFGANVGAFDGADAIGRLATTAEGLGFESLWTGEHLVLVDPQKAPSPVAPHSPFVDTVATLAFIAARTERIRVGSGIILLPQRNPIVLAKELAGVDVLSKGRLIFGVGVGYVEGEFDALGIPFRERGARTTEHIEVIRTLWTQEQPSFAGRFTSFSGIQSRPLPIQKPHPPIVVGGMSRSALRRAVAQGNGWYGFFQDLDATAAMLRSLAETAKQVERPAQLGRLEISITPPGPVDADTARRFEDLGVDRLIVMRGYQDMAGPGDADAAIRFLESTARELSLGRAA